MSMYTPQVGEHSPEALTGEARAALVEQLPLLKRRFPALVLNAEMLRGFATPPSSPSRCAFAKMSVNYSADLTTRVEPCVFGGSPDCTRCGCAATAIIGGGRQEATAWTAEGRSRHARIDRRGLGPGPPLRGLRRRAALEQGSSVARPQQRQLPNSVNPVNRSSTTCSAVQRWRSKRQRRSLIVSATTVSSRSSCRTASHRIAVESQTAFLLWTGARPQAAHSVPRPPLRSGCRRSPHARESSPSSRCRAVGRSGPRFESRSLGCAALAGRDCR